MNCVLRSAETRVETVTHPDSETADLKLKPTRSILPKVLVSRRLGVLQRLLLTHQTLLAHQASQGKVRGIGKLPRLVRLGDDFPRLCIRGVRLGPSAVTMAMAAAMVVATAVLAV